MPEYVQFEARGFHPYFDLEIVSLLEVKNEAGNYTEL